MSLLRNKLRVLVLLLLHINYFGEKQEWINNSHRHSLVMKNFNHLLLQCLINRCNRYLKEFLQTLKKMDVSLNKIAILSNYRSRNCLSFMLLSHSVMRSSIELCHDGRNKT